MNEAVGEEEVGTQAEALQCGSSVNIGLCGSFTRTSPDASYYDERCAPGLYKVWDSTPPTTPGLFYTPVVLWADTALNTSALCSAATLTGRISATYTNGNAWSDWVRWSPSWNSATGTCSFIVDHATGITTASNLASMTMEGAAFFVNHPRKVTVGLKRNCGPR